eukprot:gene13705-19594_t
MPSRPTGGSNASLVNWRGLMPSCQTAGAPSLSNWRSNAQDVQNGGSNARLSKLAGLMPTVKTAGLMPKPVKLAGLMPRLSNWRP